ncbi:MAG: ABC transporter [Rhizobiales bacterium 65-79]|jgi:iron complex transport system ATP-binding protein|nr:ABC transporter ATP-binding protein [Hyphomicrobiales bacterium]OJU04377.1 MAG: ABC transporter [Rhizobiales bacterium 65-79]
MIEARNLSVDLSSRRVVSGISLGLVPGTITGVLGPNGAGKSTLMRALAGQIASTGSIAVDGRELASLSFAERARLVAHLPQARIISWPLTVRDLVGLGRMPWQGVSRAFSNGDRALCTEAMEMMDVAGLAERPATELSGGEQARVLAARAIAQDTPVLLADEPASGLDPAHQMTMMAGLRKLAAKGRTLLVSLHDLTLAARWCDRILLMKEGRLVAEGAPADVLTAERLGEVFGILAHIDHDAGGMILAPVALAGGTAHREARP